MRPLNRKPVDKGKSAGHFRSNTKHTKSVNMKKNPMRGGIRL